MTLTFDLLLPTAQSKRGVSRDHRACANLVTSSSTLFDMSLLYKLRGQKKLE